MVESFKQSWRLQFEDYKNCTGSLGHNFVADWFVVIIISDKSLTGTLLYILGVIKSWVRVTSSSQVKVLWYRTSTKPLDKSWAWGCLWCKIVVCQPIRKIFSIRIQWIYNFHFPFLLFSQWEIICSWFHMMPVKPI